MPACCSHTLPFFFFHGFSLALENLHTLDISSLICLILAFIDWLDFFPCDKQEEEDGAESRIGGSSFFCCLRLWIQHLMLLLLCLDGNEVRRPGQSAGILFSLGWFVKFWAFLFAKFAIFHTRGFLFLDRDQLESQCILGDGVSIM